MRKSESGNPPGTTRSVVAMRGNEAAKQYGAVVEAACNSDAGDLKMIDPDLLASMVTWRFPAAADVTRTTLNAMTLSLVFVGTLI